MESFRRKNNFNLKEHEEINVIETEEKVYSFRREEKDVASKSVQKEKKPGIHTVVAFGSAAVISSGILLYLLTLSESFLVLCALGVGALAFDIGVRRREKALLGKLDRQKRIEHFKNISRDELRTICGVLLTSSAYPLSLIPSIFGEVVSPLILFLGATLLGLGLGSSYISLKESKMNFSFEKNGKDWAAMKRE
ncbi:MAG: hypothetical protein QXL16_00205 [Candidatus Micrarchaeaceae archaeon]